MPLVKDTVRVYYTGYLANGTIFDSSDEKYHQKDEGAPVTFGVFQANQAWKEVLQQMTAGAKYEFYVPPKQGYGSNGSKCGRVPPSAALVYELELVELIPKPTGMVGPDWRHQREKDPEIQSQLSSMPKHSGCTYGVQLTQRKDNDTASSSNDEKENNKEKEATTTSEREDIKDMNRSHEMNEQEEEEQVDMPAAHPPIPQGGNVASGCPFAKMHGAKHAS